MHETDTPSNESLVVTSNFPVIVAQFCKSFDADGNRDSDPFMTMVPPISVMQKEYLFTAPGHYETSDGFQVYVNILIYSCETSGVLLDGERLTLNDKVVNWMEVAGTQFSYAVITVTTAPHVLSHSRSVPFVATLYGFKMQESYGFPLKLKSELDISTLWEYDSCPPPDTTVADPTTETTTMAGISTEVTTTEAEETTYAGEGTSHVHDKTTPEDHTTVPSTAEDVPTTVSHTTETPEVSMINQTVDRTTTESILPADGQGITNTKVGVEKTRTTENSWWSNAEDGGSGEYITTDNTDSPGALTIDFLHKVESTTAIELSIASTLQDFEKTVDLEMTTTIQSTTADDQTATTPPGEISSISTDNGDGSGSWEHEPTIPTTVQHTTTPCLNSMSCNVKLTSRVPFLWEVDETITSDVTMLLSTEEDIQTTESSMTLEQVLRRTGGNSHATNIDRITSGDSSLIYSTMTATAVTDQTRVDILEEVPTTTGASEIVTTASQQLTAIISQGVATDADTSSVTTWETTTPSDITSSADDRSTAANMSTLHRDIITTEVPDTTAIGLETTRSRDLSTVQIVSGADLVAEEDMTSSRISQGITAKPYTTAVNANMITTLRPNADLTSESETTDETTVVSDSDRVAGSDDISTMTDSFYETNEETLGVTTFSTQGLSTIVTDLYDTSAKAIPTDSSVTEKARARVDNTRSESSTSWVNEFKLILIPACLLVGIPLLCALWCLGIYCYNRLKYSCTRGMCKPFRKYFCCCLKNKKRQTEVVPTIGNNTENQKHGATRSPRKHSTKKGLSLSYTDASLLKRPWSGDSATNTYMTSSSLPSPCATVSTRYMLEEEITNHIGHCDKMAGASSRNKASDWSTSTGRMHRHYDMIPSSRSRKKLSDWSLGTGRTQISLTNVIRKKRRVVKDEMHLVDGSSSSSIASICEKDAAGSSHIPQVNNNTFAALHMAPKVSSWTFQAPTLKEKVLGRKGRPKPSATSGPASAEEYPKKYIRRSHPKSRLTSKSLQLSREQKQSRSASKYIVALDNTVHNSWA